MVRTAVIAIPFIYLFTWFYERHFFLPVQRPTKPFILTGSQIYILIIALVIAAGRYAFAAMLKF